jgi:UDP-glucose 4-epimerase
MRSFVLGGAGFIGSHLTDRLVEEGPVTVYDNLSLGKREHLARHIEAKTVNLVEEDALDLAALTRAMEGHDAVFHLAASPETQSGLNRTRLDLEQGTVVTYNVLEAMWRSRVGRLIFASSSAVYGETAEPCGELDLGHLPVSFYGASKLASESLISAYADYTGLHAWIFRLASVVGPRSKHTLALEFLRKLQSTNGVCLEIQGDGRHARPYLHVSDCADGMLFGFRQSASSASPFTPSGTLREVNQLARAEGELKSRVHIFNLAPPDAASVRRIAELCVATSPYRKAEIRCAGPDQRAAGDVSQSLLRPDKLAALGFRVSHTSEQAVQVAIEATSREVFS